MTRYVTFAPLLPLDSRPHRNRGACGQVHRLTPNTTLSASSHSPTLPVPRSLFSAPDPTTTRLAPSPLLALTRHRRCTDFAVESTLSHLAQTPKSPRRLRSTRRASPRSHRLGTVVAHGQSSIAAARRQSRRYQYRLVFCSSRHQQVHQARGPLAVSVEESLSWRRRGRRQWRGTATPAPRIDQQPRRIAQQ